MKSAHVPGRVGTLRFTGQTVLGILLIFFLGMMVILHQIVHKGSPNNQNSQNSHKDPEAHIVKGEHSSNPVIKTAVLVPQKPASATPSYGNSTVTTEPHSKSRSNTKTSLLTQQRSAHSSHGQLQASNISWQAFLNMPYDESFLYSSNVLNNPDQFTTKSLLKCSAETARKVSVPILTEEDIKWCSWALSPSGGQAVVGKSWGKLTTADKRKFDNLDCNSVRDGENPSCDSTWGDVNIYEWQKRQIKEVGCDSDRPSKLNCYRNNKFEKYCVMTNAMIDFSKYKKKPRPDARTPSKTFQHDFLSADCMASHKNFPLFNFPHLFSPLLSSQKCNYVYNGTLLLYSHDDISNLGHTINDIINVWVMLWMQGLSKYAHHIEMLNIDSFRQGHNWDDQPNGFFMTYYKSLRNILKGKDFGQSTLCVKKLMIQPAPQRFFVWDSWGIDNPCTFLGPASLFQRWNLHVRMDYGLLSVDRSKQRWKVLLLVRNENQNLWGSNRSSRNYLNRPEIERALKEFLESKYSEYEFVALDIGKVGDMEAQLKLIGEVAVIVGMHGAGLAHGLHMSIGEVGCCAILEIFPKGEFTDIRGHGNMLRRMGVHYDRIDLSGENSHADGAIVPVQNLVGSLDKLIQRMKSSFSCIQPNVLDNPYLEKKV